MWWILCQKYIVKKLKKILGWIFHGKKSQKIYCQKKEKKYIKLKKFGEKSQNILCQYCHGKKCYFKKVFGKHDVDNKHM